MSGLVILFDDERSFRPGFRDGAEVIRTVDDAKKRFAELRAAGTSIRELWLDFALNPGDTTEALSELQGVDIEKVFFHSSAFSARSLIEAYLKRAGYKGHVELESQYNLI